MLVRTRFRRPTIGIRREGPEEDAWRSGQNSLRGYHDMQNPLNIFLVEQRINAPGARFGRRLPGVDRSTILAPFLRRTEAAWPWS
jgi:hypothetical protein